MINIENTRKKTLENLSKNRTLDAAYRYSTELAFNHFQDNPEELQSVSDAEAKQKISSKIREFHHNPPSTVSKALNILDFPSLIAVEMPWRMAKSGVAKGLKQTGEVFTEKRQPISPWYIRYPADYALWPWIQPIRAIKGTYSAKKAIENIKMPYTFAKKFRGRNVKEAAEAAIPQKALGMPAVPQRLLGSPPPPQKALNNPAVNFMRKGAQNIQGEGGLLKQGFKSSMKKLQKDIFESTTDTGKYYRQRLPGSPQKALSSPAVNFMRKGAQNIPGEGGLLKQGFKSSMKKLQKDLFESATDTGKYYKKRLPVSPEQDIKIKASALGKSAKPYFSMTKSGKNLERIIENASQGQRAGDDAIGTLGDIISEPEVRKLFKDVLGVKVRLGNFLRGNDLGRYVPRAAGAEPEIFVRSIYPFAEKGKQKASGESILRALYHEVTHALRDSKGRKFHGKKPKGKAFPNYERSAEKLADYAYKLSKESK